jgi:hypothetical protein
MLQSHIQTVLDKIKSRKFSDADVESIEAQLDKPSDIIALRGGIEVMLKDSLSGKVLQHSKGKNVVLYVGRSWLMQKIASTGMDSTVTMNANIVIGIGSTATALTHTGPASYLTYKTGTLSLTTASDGAAVPVMAVAASWESTELSVTGFNSIWEFLLNNSTGSAGTFLNRYLSNTFINATTSNQLLVTYTVSF